MPEDRGKGKGAPGPVMGPADLLLVHPALSAEGARVHLGAFWPDGNLGRSPAGYREVSAALFDLRAFCRDEWAGRLPGPDAELPGRIREWVDALARTWNFQEVLGVRDLDFWSFLRGGTIAWLHGRMVERRLIEHLAGDGELSVLAVGVNSHQRALLRAIGDAHAGRIRPEIAVVPVPSLNQEETIVGMRLRKMLGLCQDGWHGVRLLLEDLFVHRPKVLLVSDSRCWKRGRGGDGLRGRTDVHLEGVWREGRGRRLRLYYRTDRYDSDVGAMTAGRLAPTYLRHFLFLLAQTSRGFWEVRRIQRQWRALRENPSFREALAFEGLPLGDMLLGWLDSAVAERLPSEVRTTRRETHFLRGTRPSVVLLGQSAEDGRALVAAARSLRIPTVALQMRPFSDWDHAYLLTGRGGPPSGCLADRICVFSREAKAFLVEKGACDPSAVVITGDPRRDWLEERRTPSPEILEQIRKRWGVEAGQRVVAVACRSAQCPEVLDWLSIALEEREDAFVLMSHPAGPVMQGKTRPPGLGGRSVLRWVHFAGDDLVAGWLQAVDLLVTTTWPEAAEAILARTPAVFLRCGEQAGFPGPDPGALIRQAASAEELRSVVRDVFSRLDYRLPADERWRAFVEAVYGPPDGAAARRVIELVEGLAGEAHR